MNRLIEAALELHEFLTRHAIPYAMIGGVAVQAWGEPRLTIDLDITVLTPSEDIGPFVQLLLQQFAPRVPDPVGFARRTRVVLIQASKSLSENARSKPRSEAEWRPQQRGVTLNGPRRHSAGASCLTTNKFQTSSNGCNVDISLGVPGYEEEVIRRAVDYEVAPGKTVRLCSAEDLIIHKAVAGRPQDLIDIEGIVYRQGDHLDVEYIRRWLKEFADVLEMPEILGRFERAWSEYG